MTAAVTTPGAPMSLCPILTAQGYGTVVLTRHYSDAIPVSEWFVDHVTVEHADPQITVTDDLIQRILYGDPECPVIGVRFILTPHALDSDCQSSRHSFCGSLLHIDGANRHVVYHIGAYRDDLDAWDAAWPD